MWVKKKTNQAVPGELYVSARLWGQSQLRLHVIRQLRLGVALLVPADDARRLGELVPDGAENGRPMAHALLHRHHLPRLLLLTQSHLGHRRHVLRRVAEKGRRGGGGRPLGGGGHQGQSHLSFIVTSFFFKNKKKSTWPFLFLGKL